MQTLLFNISIGNDLTVINLLLGFQKFYEHLKIIK